MLSQMLSVSDDLRIGESSEAPREERSGELLMAIRRSLHGEAIGVWGGDARLAGLKIGEVREAGR
jgi:hypothetical protein